MTFKKSRKSYQEPMLRVIGEFRRTTRGLGAWTVDGTHLGRRT